MEKEGPCFFDGREVRGEIVDAHHFFFETGLEIGLSPVGLHKAVLKQNKKGVKMVLKFRC